MKYFILLFSIAFYTNAFSQIDARIGIYIKNLTVDQKNGEFYADLYWWLKLPASLDSTQIKEYAQLEFVNASEPENQLVETKRTKDIIYITGSCKGMFKFEPEYHAYPIDVQRLPIIIESVNQPETYIRLIPDTVKNGKSSSKLNGIDDEISVPSYKIVKAGYFNETKLYNSNFGDPDYSENMKYSRIVFNMDIKRESQSFILKILIPNLFLLAISYLVFFIPASQLEVAVGCTVTSLLASIALQLTINGNLPDIGYLTNADKLFHLFYLLITIALVQTVITFNLDKRGNKNLARKLEVMGRFVFPAILLLGIFVILG